MDEQLNAVRARYDFDRFTAAAARRRAAPIGPLSLSAENLGDIKLVRRKPDPTDGSRYTDTYRTASGDYVLVTIQPASDFRAAHESLLQFLANCMAERLPTARECGIVVGETAFANLAHPPTTIAFVRRNVFVRIALADPTAKVDLATIADAVDQQIVAAPDQP